MEPKKQNSFTLTMEKPKEEVVKNISPSLFMQDCKQIEPKEKSIASNVIETPNYYSIQSTQNNSEEKEQEVESAQPQKDIKFRLKLSVATFLIALAVCVGWIITSSIQIANANSAISTATSQTTYYVNEAKYVYELSKLDEATSIDDTSISPIAPENIFGVYAEPLNQVTDVQKTTNWFDKFCNWLSNIFG